jgi:hypothetical protein
MEALNFEQMEKVNGGGENTCLLIATVGTMASTLSVISIALGPVGWFFGGIMAISLASGIAGVANCTGML